MFDSTMSTHAWEQASYENKTILSFANFVQ